MKYSAVRLFSFVSFLTLVIVNNVDARSSIVKSTSINLNHSQRSANEDEIKVEKSPSKEFSVYSVIKPQIYHGRQKGADFFQHPGHLVVHLPIDNKNLTLDLILNTQLVPKGYFRKLQKNGTCTVKNLISDELKLCHYTGKVRNKQDSWVALSTCDGLSGVIYDGDQMHYIEKKNEKNEYFLYKNSDVIQENTCGVKEEKNKKLKRVKRNSIRNNKPRRPWNANSESRFIELVLVVDNGKYKDMNESVQAVEDYCKSLANVMNALFAPLNIFISLVGVVVWTEKDEINMSDNGDSTLTNFLRYRREKLNIEHPNDNALLITKTIFAGGVIGKALKKPICTFQYSGGVTTTHSSVLGLMATSLAHMVGHNLGMEHDTSECECPDELCIMNIQPSIRATHWSSCSRKTVQEAFAHGMDHCLRNVPVSLFQGPICGNNFVEEGEECDCGLPEYCNNTCCNPTTCKLHGNATCATGECCDLETCSVKKASQVCRQSSSECDLPEYCLGTSEFCPSDVYKIDGEICDDGNGYCYQGQCGSRSNQCKLLWGSSGQSANNLCYNLNIKGNRHGHCGYSFSTNSFTKCSQEHVFCGELQCQHNATSLHYGLEATSILSHSFINDKGNILACRTTVIDLGLSDSNPGMVPNGAKCGDRKMCLNQKCLDVSAIQEDGACPFDCYGNGWCNNLGHCHCKPGYLLPFCQYRPIGGSVDNGPPGPA